jgi:hypothetical protein
MMQHGHFKRQRGVAKSRSHELMFLCYKSRLPKQLAKARAYVDVGSPVFNEVVRNVPVLSQKTHALVSRAIRETSLQSMIGVDVCQAEADDEQQAHTPMEDDDDTTAHAATADAAAADAETAGAGAATADASAQKAIVTAALKKRKLYRQLTGCEVPWFPHDNDCELLKELCHEAGRPRWVYFGTPAGGAGIHGCIEMGCSVLALCYDDHHRTHLGPFLVERAVEAMLGCNSLVFNNAALLARAKQLRLTDTEDKKEGKKGCKEDNDLQEDKEEGGKEDKEGKKKEGKKEGKKTTRKRKQISSSDSDSDSSSSSTDAKEGSQTKKKKKA